MFNETVELGEYMFETRGEVRAFLKGLLLAGGIGLDECHPGALAYALCGRWRDTKWLHVDCSLTHLYEVCTDYNPYPERVEAGHVPGSEKAYVRAVNACFKTVYLASFDDGDEAAACARALLEYPEEEWPVCDELPEPSFDERRVVWDSIWYAGEPREVPEAVARTIAGVNRPGL